jgi:hypothetical protein
MANTINDMEQIYMNDNNIKFYLTMCSGTIISGSGAWSNNADSLLTSFRNWASTTPSPPNYYGNMCTGTGTTLNDLHRADIAILFSGKEFSGDTIGLAETPGRYCVVQHVSAGGSYTATAYGRLIVTSHELGHNFNGQHADAGTSGGDYTIMHTPYEGDSDMADCFSATNKRRISSEKVELEWREEYYPGTNTYVGIRLDYFSTFYRKITFDTTSYTVYTEFGLTNTNTYAFTFDFIFIGCRDNAGGSGNLDYGYGFYSYKRNPGQQVWYYNNPPGHNFNYADTFYTWPAFRYSTYNYGPFQWQQSTIPVVSTTLQTYTGPDTSNGIQMSNFKIYGPSDPDIGDSIIVTFTYYASGSEKDFTPYGVFVGCRDPSSNNEDFGHIQMKMSQYQTMVFNAWIIVDQSGTWQFWPCYYLSGTGFGPYQWQYKTITV